MSSQIYLDAPCLGALEKRYLSDAIDSGYVSTIGPLIPQFEKKFADYLNIKKAVSTQSGTASLHVALHELGIKKDDEVIVPVLTFVATVNPIIYVKAKPVFVDVDYKTWNINTSDIERNITKKTKAIIPVHLYGNPCNMLEIMRIAKKYNLYVIEDATESLGAIYKKQHTGTFGHLGCFSFNGNKTITTGGGGMVVGDCLNKLKHIKFLVNQSRDENDNRGYYHPELGFNYRMTNVEAALGLAQMTKLDNFLTKKKEFNSIYREELASISCLSFQEQLNGACSSWWLSSIIFEKDIDVIALQEKLKAKGVPSRRIFIPIVEFPFYKSYKKEKYENAYSIYKQGLSLPSSTLNSGEKIHYVCKVIKKILN